MNNVCSLYIYTLAGEIRSGPIEQESRCRFEVSREERRARRKCAGALDRKGTNGGAKRGRRATRQEREHGYFEPARAKPPPTIERCHQPGIRSVPKNTMVASWLSDNGSGTSGRRYGSMSGIASTWSFLTRPPCRITPMSVGSSNIPPQDLGRGWGR